MCGPDASIDLTLGAGSHTVRLANVGDTGPNLDRVIVTREDAAPAPRPTIRIHFQDDTTADAPGYLVDNFLAYGARGGRPLLWLGHRGVGDRRQRRKGDADQAGLSRHRDPGAQRNRNPAQRRLAARGQARGQFQQLPIPRLTGYAHFDQSNYPARAAWQLGVANGWYEVTVSVGDTGGPNDSQNRLFVEGTLNASWTPTSAFKTELVTPSSGSRTAS